MEPVDFAENQGGSAQERLNFEQTAIQNARFLWEMGEDYRHYLSQNEIIVKDKFKEMFPDGE
jgi:hypothetical protein